MPGSDSAPLIEVEGLARRYGKLLAVSGVNLRVGRGEVLALLGPNGAGKSTTLGILSGNLAPHAGSVKIAGHDLLARPRAAKRFLGYLPEHPPVYPELTVDEYLCFCARLRGVPRAAVRGAVTEACARAGLADVRGRLIGNLSKGYRQRTGIAQAIVHRPPVVVLDEPTVGLDPVQIRSMRTLIRELAAEAAVIVSTHLLPEAGEVATRVAILSSGRVVHESVAGADASANLRLRIALSRAPPASRLARVAGVAAAAPADAGAFVVTALPDQDPREALARAALEEGWGLLALGPYRRSLEEEFLAVAGAQENVP